MKSSHTILAAWLCCLAADAAPDFLRFDNGDQLTGQFLGMTASGDIRFESGEMKQPAEFRIDSVRHLVMRGGKPKNAQEILSHLGLTNGDRIPGRVTGIDDSHIMLDTKFAGTLRVPKDHVSLLAANPLGGRIHYFGPFSEEGWNILRAKPTDEGAKEPEEDADAAKEKSKGRGPWEFSGAAWYWSGKSGSSENPGTFALARSEGMSDRSILRFRVDWKDRVGMSVAFHADFATGEADKPAEKKEDADKVIRREPSVIPSIFGNCYVLQIYSGHMMLYRSTWSAENGPGFEPIQTNANFQRFGEDRTNHVEIRSNRTNGHIALYMNDEFVAQWTEPVGKDGDTDGYAGKGNGFGFSCHAGASALRISEISVSEWNGMPDSARSMEVDDKDVVLMTNGTDRFAGKVLGMEGADSIRFESRHGSILVPLEEIAEIRFARARLAKSEPSDGPLLHFAPVGCLSANMIAGDKQRLKLQHPILGPLELDTDPLIMIEYKPGTRTADAWNEDL